MWDNSSPPPCYGERSWCETKHGSQFSVQHLRSSIAEHLARKPVRSWCNSTRSYLLSSLCSSIAEPPVDNRQTGARYPAEGPVHFIAGWCSQSAQLPEEERVRVQFQVQRPVHFQSVIGVTATCLSSKQWMPVQLRHGAPSFNSPVAEPERRRSRKADHAGAKPAGGPISVSRSKPRQQATPSVVSSVSTRRCGRRGAGANPAEGTISNHHRAQGKEPSHRSAKPGYPVRVRGARPPFRRVSLYFISNPHNTNHDTQQLHETHRQHTGPRTSR